MVVNLGSQGLSEGDNIAPHLNDLSGAEDVQIPSGTYGHGGTIDFDLNGSTLEGVGGRVVIKAPSGNRNHLDISASGTSKIRNLTFAGKKGNAGPNESTRIDVQSGRLTLEGVHWPDGSINGSDAHGVYVGTLGGALRMVNCRVEGFGDNGLYASNATGAPVEIEGGIYRNNNIANIRIGSPNSYVRGAYVEGINAQTPQSANGHTRPRGIWLRDGANGTTIENCGIAMDSDNAGAIQSHPAVAGETITVNNCRIRQDGSAPALYDEGGTWVGSGNHLTGSGDLTFPNSMVACRGSGCQPPQQDTAPPEEPDEGPSGGNAGRGLAIALGMVGVGIAVDQYRENTDSDLFDF